MSTFCLLAFCFCFPVWACCSGVLIIHPYGGLCKRLAGFFVVLVFFVILDLLAFPCFHVGLLALPLCGAAPTFLCPCQRKVGKRKAPKTLRFLVRHHRGMAPHEVSPPHFTRHRPAHDRIPRTAHFVTKGSSTRLRVASPNGITFTSRHVTSRHVTSRHVTSRHITSHHVTSPTA